MTPKSSQKQDISTQWVNQKFDIFNIPQNKTIFTTCKIKNGTLTASINIDLTSHSLIFSFSVIKTSTEWGWPIRRDQHIFGKTKISHGQKTQWGHLSVTHRWPVWKVLLLLKTLKMCLPWIHDVCFYPIKAESVLNTTIENTLSNTSLLGQNSWHKADFFYVTSIGWTKTVPALWI